jgi:nicotinamidase-related amidase
MKAGYFTLANIDRKGPQMLSRFADHRQRHVLRYRPEESCLFVIDMQGYFLDERSHAFLPSAPAIVPRIQSLVEAYRRKEYPIVCTRHVNDRSNARMLARWWNDIITEDDEGSALIPAFQIEGSTLISKTQYDAFYQTPLEDLLQRHLVRQVVITGLMTHLCCETTARSAFVRGYEVIFGIDATATENEELHMAALSTLAHGFAIPVLVKELIKYLV